MPTQTHRLPDPPLLCEFPLNLATRLLPPGDIRATPEQRAAYLRFTQAGDPPADAVVAMIRRLPTGEGRRLFETAVEQGIDAIEDPPDELVAFFAAVDVPYWVDTDRLDLACRVIGRTGAAGITALAMLALMGGYMASRVAKILVGTGDLERMAPRRIAQTTKWFTEVTTPGGLQRHAPGFTNTLRVRLMHAMVRAGMNRRPDWDYAAWDHPVNQSTIAGTTLLFAVAHLAGSQALGLHFDRAERAAIYHLWRYVGHLLGCDPAILPADESDYWKLFWLQADYEFRTPDADSIRLAQALMRAIGPAVAGEGCEPRHDLIRRVVTGLMCAYARLVLGKTHSDFLELPDHKAFQAAVIALAATTRILEYPRRVLPGATRLSEAFGRHCQLALARRMITQHTGDTAAYGRHDHFADAAHKPNPRSAAPREHLRSNPDPTPLLPAQAANARTPLSHSRP
ncbi:DUF2236 domain-containing protein [Nocardia abscessus]|uniref:DUF2236 domain-containing protein n=1 Tax=Nocardia abscessus TaxID=120957 RepID=A0ABS0CID7_9NOCA|nr:oxygenase MpaB family protein [Nocardia abscessus]MBF6229278.1 DUF2236 domain-containing protein [Nocardia abscessus]